VAARDQLEAELAFSQAGLAGQQHADAEDVHEDAVARRPLGEVLAEVAADDVDDVAGRLVGDEERDVGAVAERDQLVGRHLRVGDDQHRRLERHDARDAAVGDVDVRLVEVRDLAPADDLDAVGMDVVEVADEVGGRARVADRGLVEVALGVGVAGDPLPVQSGPELLEQRLGADDGGLHRSRDSGRAPALLRPPT
jgi:hypothetical protein